MTTAEAPIDNRSTGWSSRHEAAFRIASRSSAPARYALVAAVTEPRLMNAPLPWPTLLLTDSRISECSQSRIQRRAIVSGLVRMTGGGGVGHLPRRDEIDAAHLGRIKSETRRNHVHQPFM